MATALLALAFWTVFIGLAVTHHIVSRDRAYDPVLLPFDAILVTMGAACSLAIACLLARLGDQRFAVQLGAGAVALLLLSVPFEYLTIALHGWLDLQPRLKPITLPQLLGASIYWWAPLGLWTAGLLAWQHERRARARERQAIVAQAEAQEAQVRALRYQINPHFLYNTLNSVSSLIMDGRNAEADAMVLELAAFFRASLSVDPAADVPLKDEIEHQLLYLGIEQARFADRVQVTVDVPPTLEKAGVPSFILQPLVENSMKHGLRGAGRKLHLKLAARAENDNLMLEVIDDGAGSGDLPGTGTGLANVERRLRTRYGDRAGVEAGGGVGGFRVRLTLPLTLSA